MPHQPDRTAMLHSQLLKFGREKGKMRFSKQQKGIWAGCIANSIPGSQGVPCWMGFLHSLSTPKKYQGEKNWQNVKKKSVQLNLKHPSNQTHNVFFPFGGLFLHLFNPSSPFGSQHCSNRKSCFEIKKQRKKKFCFEKMLK